MSPEVAVRPARPDELVAVMGILDSALLDTHAETVRASIHDEAVLVAVADGRVLGALVLDGNTITALAVRRARRDQGLGTALIEAAARSSPTLSANFRAELRPFYAGLGFTIRPATEPGRLVGIRE